MSTEVSEGAAPGPGRRPSRSGEGGAPVSGALTIVLAVVAVVAGFLILRSITNDDGTASTTPGGNVPVTTPVDTTPAVTDPPTTTTTLPQRVTDGASVVVANANGVNGSAGQMSRALEAAGYAMGDATNAAASIGQLQATVIYFAADVPAAQAVAESVNRDLGGDVSISALQPPAPTSDGSVDGDVLVMLGNDKAGKTLEELAPATAGNGPAVTSPEVSGDEAEVEDGADG
jgi:hypothetical protein